MNNMEHAHDGTAVQLEYRPAIKCMDPIHGNPVTCDHDDINEANQDPLPKDENGFTPTRVVEGGPLVDNDPEPVEKSEKKEKKEKK